MSDGLDRCGLVRWEDLDDPRRARLFEDMARFSRLWLCDRRTWWPDLPWPPDALRQWSRQFEYPYAFHHLQETAGPRVLDAGSGITFFPFYLALHGFDVTCADRDPRVEGAFRTLETRLPARLGVRFQNASLDRLPWDDSHFDHVVCVSVLEHLAPDNRPPALRELARVLRPGGTLVLTADVWLGPPETARGLPLDRIPEFAADLRAAGLRPKRPVLDRERPERLLTTLRFRDRPEWLPWTHLPERPGPRRWAARIVRRWLRIRTFRPLALATFACTREQEGRA
jgi:SAM-dependent methyltransferase